MNRKCGAVLMTMGLVLLAVALGLYVRNRAEDKGAGAASARVLAAVEEIITGGSTRPDPEREQEMTEAQIDGQWYIGYLSIPSVGLELPVLSGWDYDRLKIAPCRFRGTAEGEDLMILAHNYRSHFGPLRRLAPGDRVTFTDMDGRAFEYQVAASAVVEPTALEKVTADRHELTLITCTYGGKTRLIVCCDSISLS